MTLNKASKKEPDGLSIFPLKNLRLSDAAQLHNEEIFECGFLTTRKHFETKWNRKLDVNFHADTAFIVLPTDSKDTSESSQRRREAQANRITSALILARTFIRGHGCSFHLIDEPLRSLRTEIFYNISNSIVEQVRHESEIQAPIINAQSLLSILRHENSIELFNALEPLKNHTTIVHNSMAKIIGRAVLHLTQSRIYDSDAIKLLNAVTAIEILLGLQSGESSYSKIEVQLYELIGAAAYEKYDASKIFGSRHRYVHHGEDVEQNLEFQELATLAILNFTLLVQQLTQFENRPIKETICCFLQHLKSADKLEKSLGDSFGAKSESMSWQPVPLKFSSW